MTVSQEFEWDEQQKLAISRCCDMQNRIVPITGPAGTGKTSIIKEVYTRLTTAGYDVVLAAPTGKAAKRIQEATGISAMTLHRLLEYPFPNEIDEKTGKPLDTGTPKRGRNNPLNEDIILCDEYAMVNKELHSNLIFALKPGARVCMFGDMNQLQPIETTDRSGKPSPFQVALTKFKDVCVVLETIHRTAEGSGIAANASYILAGRMPRRLDDFVLKLTDQPVRELETHIMDWYEQGVSYATNQAQVIVPQRKKSWVGSYKLNNTLQYLLNPNKSSNMMKLPRKKWEEDAPVSVALGDKVIWTENSYDLRNEPDKWTDEGRYIPNPEPTHVIMNGESGVVVLLDEDEMHIDVGDRVVIAPRHIILEQPIINRKTGAVEGRRVIDIYPWTNIDLGYAVTTHKAQGSEWSHITYVMNKSATALLSRHNLYTAVTRARKHVTVISDQRSLTMAVRSQMSFVDRQRLGEK